MGTSTATIGAAGVLATFGGLHVIPQVIIGLVALAIVIFVGLALFKIFGG